MDGPECEHYAPTPGLELVKGELSHAAVAGRGKDHVRRASSKEVRRTA